jgi:hypothetical protein
MVVVSYSITHFANRFMVDLGLSEEEIAAAMAGA